MQSGFTNTDPPRSKYRAFGTFLETLRDGEGRMPEGAAQFQGLSGAPTAGPPSQASSRQVLEYLARNGPQPAARVVEELQVGILEFGPVLNALVEAGLVQVERSGPTEVLGLTTLGNTVASLP